MKKIVAISGGFDPLHKGHIDLINYAKTVFTNLELVAIVNSDKFLIKKKGYKLLDWNTRIAILNAISGVRAVSSIDEDMTVCKSLASLRPVVFLNGGDREKENIPETKICKELGIEIVDMLGVKVDSSSDIVGNAFKYFYKDNLIDSPKLLVEKPWGKEIIFSRKNNCTFKHLIMNPLCSTSLQLHQRKAECMCLISGKATLEYDGHSYKMEKGILYTIIPYHVHRLTADTSIYGETIIAEMSYGSDKDIVRLKDNYGRTEKI